MDNTGRSRYYYDFLFVMSKIVLSVSDHRDPVLLGRQSQDQLFGMFSNVIGLLISVCQKSS